MRADGKQSNALAELVVVPITLLRRKPGSSVRVVFVGERGGVLLKKGELDGVRRKVE